MGGDQATLESLLSDLGLSCDELPKPWGRSLYVWRCPGFGLHHSAHGRRRCGSGIRGRVFSGTLQEGRVGRLGTSVLNVQNPPKEIVVKRHAAQIAVTEIEPASRTAFSLDPSSLPTVT